MDSLLHETFEALEAAAVTYSVLRGFEELETTAGHLEVDLLVAPDHLRRLATSLAARNFVSLPGWGHAPHHFFVGYNRDTGFWLKLDVVTDLLYGKPLRVMRVDLAAICLRHRVRREPAYVLAPEHEFFTLFLHCLLDKAGFRAERAERLAELHLQLCEEAPQAAQVAELLKRYAGSILSWQALSQAIASQDWRALLHRRKKIAHRLFRREIVKTTLRALSNRLLLRLRPLLFALRRRGVAVALLAPDGAGKSTLAKKLTQENYIRGKLVYMGTNIEASTIGLPTTRWLHRRLKAQRGKALRPDRLLLKACGFVNQLLEQWYRSAAAAWFLLRGRFVVFDRYFYDSWLTERAKTPWKRLRKWLFEAGCPKPDLVVLLDAPGEVLFRRKGEHSVEWLEKQRRAYHGLQEKLSNMIIVDATAGPEEVRREVIALLWRRYGDRRAARVEISEGLSSVEMTLLEK